MLRTKSMWNELSDVVAAKISGGANCPRGTEMNPDQPCCRLLLEPWFPDHLMPGYCCITVVPEVPDYGISRADADAEARGRNATTRTGTVTRPGFSGSSSSSRSG